MTSRISKALLALLLGMSALATVAANNASLVQQLAGRYGMHFKNGLVDGETYESDNVVEIVPVSDHDAYVRLRLEFYNGHLCAISGVAHEKNGRLTYLDPSPQPEGAYQFRCKLSISRQNERLLIDDAGGSCSSYCGVRGTLSQQTLPFGSRRPITYMNRLKASRQYIGAMQQWQSQQGR